MWQHQTPLTVQKKEILGSQAACNSEADTHLCLCKEFLFSGILSTPVLCFFPAIHESPITPHWQLPAVYFLGRLNIYQGKRRGGSRGEGRGAMHSHIFSWKDSQICKLPSSLDIERETWLPFRVGISLVDTSLKYQGKTIGINPFLRTFKHKLQIQKFCSELK